MKIKCLLIVTASLFVAARTASLGDGRNIYVEVVYDRPEDEPGSSVAKRNLQEVLKPTMEEVQEELVEVEKVEVSNEIQSEHLLKGNQNLMEKIQLLPDDSLKTVIPEQTQSRRSAVISQVQEIIYKGIDNIRCEVEQYLSANKEQTINEYVWRDLNASVDSFILSLRDKEAGKQEQSQNSTFFQNMITQFQTFGENFIQNLRPNNTQSDEGSSGGFGQNVIGFFQSGFQQITGNLSNFGSSQGTVLGDENTSQSSNPFTGFINQVQNFFGQNNPFPGQGNQSDDSSTQRPGFGQAFQNAASQIGQVINNNNPFRPSTQAPGVEGDEQTSQGPQQAFQNVINNFGQAISNANPFRPSTQAPGSQSEGETSSSSQPFQFIQNVFGGIIPGQTTKAPESGSTQNSNPIVAGIQNAGGQVQQFFNQSNLSLPGGFGNSSNFTPPSIENIGNQFSEVVGSITPPSNPIEAAQNLAGQIPGSDNNSNNNSKQEAGKSKVVSEEIMTASD